MLLAEHEPGLQLRHVCCHANRGLGFQSLVLLDVERGDDVMLGLTTRDEQAQLDQEIAERGEEFHMDQAKK